MSYRCGQHRQQRTTHRRHRFPEKIARKSPEKSINPSISGCHGGNVMILVIVQPSLMVVSTNSSVFGGYDGKNGGNRAKNALKSPKNCQNTDQYRFFSGKIVENRRRPPTTPLARHVRHTPGRCATFRHRRRFNYPSLRYFLDLTQ